MTVKTALITGGGGSIAEAVALRLDAMGYKLILTDINRERAARVAQKLGNKAEIIVCDQRNSKSVQALIATIAKKHPDLDVLVNNAGYLKTGRFLDQSADEINLHTEINLMSPARLIRGIAPLMVKRGSGAIVNIVSIGGILALADSVLYSATKFGLRGLTAALHDELRYSGVKVSGIYPSAVDTPMLLNEALHGGTPLNWVNAVQSPEDVAAAVVKAIRTGRLEIYVPYFDGLLTRFAVLFPWLPLKLMPVLRWLGERGRKKWLMKKGVI